MLWERWIISKNTEPEDYGRIGTNSYKAAVDFIVPDTVDTQDAEAVSSYIDSIEHYFNHDSDGNRTGLDVAEFCAKATKAGLMELDEVSGEYKVAGQRTMQDFADGLNLSLPMVQAMFGEMEEFGGEFDWADEAVKTLGDLGMAAGKAKGRIEELSGDENLDIQIDVSDIDSTEDKIAALDQTIQQMQDYKGTLEVDSSQVEDANTIIEYCVTQKQMLEAPAVMSVDVSQVDGELGNALSLLQQFQDATNNVEAQAAVGADTSEAQGKVDSLVSEINGLSPEIKATLGINGESEATITASIEALTPKMMVEAGVDSVEHGNYIDPETIRELADSDSVWVPTLVTIRNLRGCGRYKESVLDPIIELAAKNLRLAYKYRAKVALGSDAGAYMVLHGKGLMDEYQAFMDILGESGDVRAWLADGEKRIQDTFRRPES